MPAEVADVEDVLDDDAITEVDSVEEVITTTRKRLSKKNTYIFENAEGDDGAVSGKEKLVYEDGAKIEGFRIFAFAQTPDDFVADEKNPTFKLKRNKERCLEGASVYVVARNADIAMSWLMEAKGWFCGLYQTIAKSGAGRSKFVVAKGMLEYGKFLALVAYGLTPPEGGNHNDVIGVKDDLTVIKGFESQDASFKEYYGPGGKYDHYREDDGTWKEWTKDE